RSDRRLVDRDLLPFVERRHLPDDRERCVTVRQHLEAAVGDLADFVAAVHVAVSQGTPIARDRRAKTSSVAAPLDSQRRGGSGLSGEGWSAAAGWGIKSPSRTGLPTDRLEIARFAGGRSRFYTPSFWFRPSPFAIRVVRFPFALCIGKLERHYHVSGVDA